MSGNVSTEMKCPKCGKEMAEEPKFKGLWMCPDGKVRLNESAPFRFKCGGLYLTEEGARAFDRELLALSRAADRGEIDLAE